LIVRLREEPLAGPAFVLKIAAFVLARRGPSRRACRAGRARAEFKILIFRTDS
jgi:hypothetical protein